MPAANSIENQLIRLNSGFDFSPPILIFPTGSTMSIRQKISMPLTEIIMKLSNVARNQDRSDVSMLFASWGNCTVANTKSHDKRWH